MSMMPVAMLGFEQLLMQIVVPVNGTATQVAGDAFINSLNSVIGSITALIIAISGIVIAIISKRSDGRTKTKQEESLLGGAEAVQLIMQKLAETRAEVLQVGKATMSLATTEDQRRQLDTQVAPILTTTSEGINTIYDQIPAVQKLLGIRTANVDINKQIPRESETTLRTLNSMVAKARFGE